MITHPALVYKSTRPDEHLPIALANAAERDRLLIAQQMLAESLVPGSAVHGTVADSSASPMLGIRVASRDGVTVPSGLRWNSTVDGLHVLVPARMTDAGRTLAVEMGSLSFRPRSLGAVSQTLLTTDGIHDYATAATIEILGSDVYATYRHHLRNSPRDKAVVDRDPGWTQIPLSVFYAVREAADAAFLEAA